MSAVHHVPGRKGTVHLTETPPTHSPPRRLHQAWRRRPAAGAVGALPGWWRKSEAEEEGEEKKTIKIEQDRIFPSGGVCVCVCFGGYGDQHTDLNGQLCTAATFSHGSRTGIQTRLRSCLCAMHHSRFGWSVWRCCHRPPTHILCIPYRH